MRIITSPEEMQATSRALRCEGKRLGLVPTMGALHEGHLSLVRMARSQAQVVAASIFVNPLQFAPGEDFERYPRDWERDRKILETERVDLLFAPTAAAMYPAAQATYITVEGLSDRLCGRSRPGHFRGVATVVAKLLNIVQPSLAFFGQKDATQVAIIRRMVRELNFESGIVIGPTVRDPDGLALSSRNAYLDAAQRKSASVLYRALTRIQTLADQGESRAERLKREGLVVLAQEPSVRLDYLEIVDQETLEPLESIGRGALLAIAAYIGPSRLIDNIVLHGPGIAARPH
ncbi:MAG: pantoate--beta-alanine ligase [Candidatus Korobacteraceae bacterium]